MLMRGPISILVLLAFAMPAAADEMPARKPGLWEVTMTSGAGGPGERTMRQCIDAATDKMMQSSEGPNAPQQCAKRDVKRSGDTVTIDSTCSFGGRTRTSHAVISGKFDSAYTMTVTSQGDGAPAGRTMTMSAKWLGPCAADQKPGDMIMGNGMKINILEARKRGGPPGAAIPSQ